MLKKIMPFIFIIVLIGSCKKKYPDDYSRFHTSSPNKRLTCHRWKIKSWIPFYPGSEIPLVRDMECAFNTNGHSWGGCSTIYLYTSSGGHERLSYIYYFEGNWEFIDNNTKIKVANDATHYTIWTIKQLERKDMKITSDSVALTLEQ